MGMGMNFLRLLRPTTKDVEIDLREASKTHNRLLLHLNARLTLDERSTGLSPAVTPLRLSEQVSLDTRLPSRATQAEE